MFGCNICPVVIVCTCDILCEEIGLSAFLLPRLTCLSATSLFSNMFALQTAACMKFCRSTRILKIGLLLVKVGDFSSPFRNYLRFCALAIYEVHFTQIAR